MESLDVAARVMVTVQGAEPDEQRLRAMLRDWAGRIGGTVRAIHASPVQGGVVVVTGIVWVGDMTADLPGVRP